MASVCTLGGVLFIGGIFMATKEFKTIEEQMDLLVSRGLSIPDRKKAAEETGWLRRQRTSIWLLTDYEAAAETR